jgi:U2 small nuclear ribonucleoprotein B''
MDEDNKDTDMDQAVKEEEELAIPPDANETIYIRNLNEKVKLDVLKKSLEALFSTYGTVLSVTAHRNVRMRGQAFVAFDSKEPAAKAVSEVVGFPLYGKPMVSDR